MFMRQILHVLIPEAGAFDKKTRPLVGLPGMASMHANAIASHLHGSHICQVGFITFFTCAHVTRPVVKSPIYDGRRRYSAGSSAFFADVG